MRLTQRDSYQISQNEHDEQLNAKRVTLVGTDLTDFKNNLNDALTGALKNIKVDVQAKTENKEQQIVKEVEYREIEKPVIVKEIEYREIEKPVIVKEIEYREIPVPRLMESTLYKEIEKPIFIEKISNLTKYIIVSQSLIILGLLIKLFIK